MASVHRRQQTRRDGEKGDPVWVVKWRNPAGKQASKTFPLQRDANRFKAQLEHDIHRGAYVDPADGRETVQEWAERWQAKKLGWSASTAEHVAVVFRRHLYPVLGGYPMGALRPSDIDAWVAYLKAVPLAPATIGVAFSHLSGLMKAAVRDQLIAYNPCTGVELPKVRSLEVVPPTVSEVETLTSLMPAHWKAIVAVGVGLGLRSGEALGLTVDRVNFLGREVRVDRQAMTLRGRDPHHAGPKNDSGRTIPLPDTVGERLAAHLQRYGPGEGGLVFHNDDRGMWRRQRLSETINRAVRLSAGDLPVGLRYHHLRHFYASFLIASGESVKTVQNRLGHKSAVETLSVYGHLWPDNEEATRRAVDAMFGKMLREGLR